MLLNLFRKYLTSVNCKVPARSRRSCDRFLQNPLTLGLHRNAEPLEDRTLLAAQLVTAGGATLSVAPSQEITIPVTYQTFDGTAAALGNPAALQAQNLFNLTFHYDSSELTFVRFENAKTDNGHQGVQDGLESGVTPDADPNTDRVVQTSFINFGSSFPVPATAAEIKLFDAVFTVSSGFSTCQTGNGWCRRRWLI
jgi:hypothetical protein